MLRCLLAGPPFPASTSCCSATSAWALCGPPGAAASPAASLEAAGWARFLAPEPRTAAAIQATGLVSHPEAARAAAATAPRCPAPSRLSCSLPWPCERIVLIVQS